MHPSRSSKISANLAFLFFSFSFLVHSQAPAKAAQELSKCWTYPLVESTVVTSAADGSQVYLGLATGSLETLDRNGRRIWSADLGGQFSSNFVTSGSRVYVVTSPGGPEGEQRSQTVLRSLSKETGVTQWTVPLPAGDTHYLHLFNESVIAVSKSGSIRSIGLTDGKLLWTREITAGFLGSPSFSPNAMVIAGTTNNIFKVSLLTGELEGLFTNQYPVTSLLLNSLSPVITGDERGNITLLETGAEKPVWRFKTGGQITSLMEIGRNVMAASYDNFVYMLDGRDGDVIWKRRLAGRAAHVVKVSETTALLSSVDESSIAMIDLATGKVLSQLALPTGEKLLAEPAAINGSVYLFTTGAVYGYSISRCENAEGGQADSRGRLL